MTQAASGRVWMLVGRSARPMNRCTRKTEQESKKRMGERRRPGQMICETEPVLSNERFVFVVLMMFSKVIGVVPP